MTAPKSPKHQRDVRPCPKRCCYGFRLKAFRHTDYYGSSVGKAKILFYEIYGNLSTRHNAVTHDGQLGTRFYGVTS